MNGTKLGSQTTYPSEVTFSCDDGFHLRGSKRRRCTAGGTWSGLKATCEGNDLKEADKFHTKVIKNGLMLAIILLQKKTVASSGLL